MLPRPRSGLDVYCTPRDRRKDTRKDKRLRNGPQHRAVRCGVRRAVRRVVDKVLAYWLLCLGALGGLLVSGCTDQAAQTQQAPAVSVPHGLLDLTAGTSKTMPRASAVAALAELTELSGLKFHRLQHDGADVAALIEIDLARFAPKMIAAPKGISPAQAIAQTNLSVIVGSSFASQVQRKQPLGVLQINGTLLQELEPHGYTRILGISDLSVSSGATGGGVSRFKVVHRSEWPLESLHSALQAGPGIIEKGLLDISERDLTRQKYFRSFVAECGDRAVVGTTLVPMHLYTLGGELVDFFASQQLPCSEVVNLAGDREAVLLVRNEQRAAYLGDPQPLKAGLIGFTGP